MDVANPPHAAAGTDLYLGSALYAVGEERRSGVWKPDGEVLCRAGAEATLLFADLDRAALDAYR